MLPTRIFNSNQPIILVVECAFTIAQKKYNDSGVSRSTSLSVSHARLPKYNYESRQRGIAKRARMTKSKPKSTKRGKVASGKATGLKPETKKSVSDDDRIIGMNVRKLRRQRHMTQDDLGQMHDITFQQIQKYERGANRIAAGRLAAFAKGFGVSIEELYDGIDFGDDPRSVEQIIENENLERRDIKKELAKRVSRIESLMTLRALLEMAELANLREGSPSTK